MSYKNKVTYSQNDVDAWVSQHIENDATNLAYQHCRVEIGELSAAARAMDRAFKKILETFPDACLFSADSGLTLVLGDPHDDDRHYAQGQNQRVVCVKRWPHMEYVTGGCW